MRSLSHPPNQVNALMNDSTEDTPELIQIRRDKLSEFRELGVNPYINRFKVTHTLGPVTQENRDLDKEALETRNQQVVVAGRMISKRKHGKTSFANIQDGTGSVQVFIRKNDIGDEAYDLFAKFDIGDFIGVEGTVSRTKTGELTIFSSKITLLTKSLLPLPEKWHGLKDVELRYRQRYVDLIVNPDSKQVFVARSRIIQAIRSFLNERSYLEVETPMMHPIPGGASARPFATHHNALDMALFLRIAPELYLKRLVVGGMEKVFEINRNFRNEGISTRHNPEFSMLEFYEAYQDFTYLMDFTEELLRSVTQTVLGTTTLNYQQREIDFGKPFKRMTITQAILAFHSEYSEGQLSDRDFLINRLTQLGTHYNPDDGIGGLQLSLFDETTEHLLFEPTFIVDYPAEVSPLARRNDLNPEITDRFELYIAGREIANGFSELNDPEDQAERFMAQSKAKDAGDHEAMHYDADYIRALEYGLPPTAGEGIGIDRLVMLFTDSPSIRDVILFPQLRHED